MNKGIGFTLLRIFIDSLGCNFLMTKIPRGYKTVCRNKEGKIHEYTTKITENGALQVRNTFIRYTYQGCNNINNFLSLKSPSVRF